MTKAKAKSAKQPKQRRNQAITSKVVVKGSGAYTIREVADKVLKMIPKGTFASAGQAIGGVFGGPGGALLGRAAGQGLSLATGYGDYILNDIVHKNQTGIPHLDPNAPRSITHSEFVADVLAPGTVNFTVMNTFSVNPGDNVLFPWLANIAQRFAKYRFRQLIFEFRSSSSDYATNSALGAVILAPNYNPLMNAPTSKAVMEAWSGAVSAKPSNGMYAGIECEKKSNPVRWVRNPSVSNSTQLTELCDFFVAVSGSPATAGSALGELWVHYNVDLMEPLLALPAIPTGTEVRLSGTASTTLAAAGIGSITNSTLNFTSDTYPNALSQCMASGTQPPIGTYLFWANTSVTNQGQIGFGRVGTYLLRFGFAPTVAFGATANPAFNTTFSDGISSYTRPAWNDNGGLVNTTVPVYQCIWLVNIKTAGCTLTTTFNSAVWTTATNIAGVTPFYLTIVT